MSRAGALAVFTGWPLYALAVCGACSGVLVQAALRAGPLTVSQPLLAVVNPMISVLLSVWLIGEHFTDNPATVAMGAVAFLGVGAGVVMLTLTGPRRQAQSSWSPRRDGATRRGGGLTVAAVARQCAAGRQLGDD